MGKSRLLLELGKTTVSVYYTTRDPHESGYPSGDKMPVRKECSNIQNRERIRVWTAVVSELALLFWNMQQLLYRTIKETLPNGQKRSPSERDMPLCIPKLGVNIYIWRPIVGRVYTCTSLTSIEFSGQCRDFHKRTIDQ